MVEKTVRCPKCSKTMTFSGKPGESIKVTCPSCKEEGKITFNKSNSSYDSAINVSNLKKVYGDLTAVNEISFAVKKERFLLFLVQMVLVKQQLLK